MILSDRPAEIADVVDCSECSVFAIQLNLRHFGLIEAPRMLSDDPEVLHLRC